jgi:anti-sigma regulatory factor (Ser/Thr protein kinase)
VHAATEQANHSTSELRLLAQPSELVLARKFAHRAAVAFGFDEDRCDEVVCAFNEAVTNAIRHGRADSQGHIGLSVRSDAERLTFVVRDHGTFVGPVISATVAVKGIPPSAESGRGFALMAGLMDSVELHVLQDGTSVCMSKVRA